MSNPKRYEELREAELYAAWLEAHAAVAKGDTVSETAQEHIARLKQDAATNAG